LIKASYANPYIAPRLSAVSVTKRPAEMTDEEIARLIGMTEEDMLRLGIGRDRLTDPEKILRWMGTEAQVDPQPGGRYLVV
jgi:hypothetical protein